MKNRIARFSRKRIHTNGYKFLDRCATTTESSLYAPICPLWSNFARIIAFVKGPIRSKRRKGVSDRGEFHVISYLHLSLVTVYQRNSSTMKARMLNFASKIFDALSSLDLRSFLVIRIFFIRIINLNQKSYQDS